MIKLNLGCGEDIREGFINVDIREMPGVDKIVDLENDFPFKDVDYIRAYDVLEHFSHRQTDVIFKRWINGLKIGGTIELCVPNIFAMLYLYSSGINDPRERYDDAWGYFVANVFGGQDYPENTHKTTFSIPRIQTRLHWPLL